MALSNYLDRLPADIQVDLLAALQSTGFKQLVSYGIRGIEHDMANLSTAKDDAEFASDYKLLQAERNVLREFEVITEQLNAYYQLEPTAEHEGD